MLHQEVADTVTEGLWFLLNVVAFRLKGCEADASSSNMDLESHEVLEMRHRLLKLLSVCLGLHSTPSDADGNFDDDDIDLKFAPEYELFAFRLKKVAVAIFSDMRSLFPAYWADTESPFLQKCAIRLEQQDTLTFAIGQATGRFFINNEDKVRYQSHAFTCFLYWTPHSCRPAAPQQCRSG
jgi:hypothetical protein